MSEAVSIIMAVHNGEAYLASTLESLLAQSHRDFELLIMNDGSTDRTEEIVHSFRDDRIVVGTENSVHPDFTCFFVNVQKCFSA